MKISQSFLAAVMVELTNLPFGASSSGCDDLNVSTVTEKLNSLSLTSPPGTCSETMIPASAGDLTAKPSSSQPEGASIGSECPMDIQKKMTDCTDLGCVEEMLEMVREAPIELKVKLMSNSSFSAATGRHIINAMKKGYDHYLECLIMAVECTGEATEVRKPITLKKELASNIDILLGYAYGKPWCSPNIWNEFALQFGVRFSEWTSGSLISEIFRDELQDVSQGNGNILNEIRNSLRQQSENNSLLDNIIKYDWVEPFRLLYEQGKIELNFESILKCKSMRILSFLSSKNIPLPQDRALSSVHLGALIGAIESNDLKMIRYLLEYPGPKMNVHYLHGYVLLSTLKLLYAEENKHIFKGTTFNNLDLEEIKFLIDLGPNAYSGSWSPLMGIFERGDSKLKQWTLENWEHSQLWKHSSMWGEFIVKEFELFKEIHGRHGFFPRKNALKAIYEKGRLDIVKWWHEKRPEDIIESFKQRSIMYAIEPVLGWILGIYRDRFKNDAKNILGSALLGRHYDFVKWAERNGLGLPDCIIGLAEERDVKMLDWLRSKGVSPNPSSIKHYILEGNFSALELAIKYPDLDPGEEFIRTLGGGAFNTEIDWDHFKTHYHRIKHGNKGETFQG